MSLGIRARGDEAPPSRWRVSVSLRHAVWGVGEWRWGLHLLDVDREGEGRLANCGVQWRRSRQCLPEQM